MDDNTLAQAGTDAARPNAEADSGEAEILARFDADDGTEDFSGQPPAAVKPAKGAEQPSEDEADQSGRSNEDDDVLFADEADDAPETDKAASSTIELDGEAIPLETIKEWRDAGLRQADYTRKSQALAEERRGIEAERARVKQHEQDVAQALSIARSIVQAYAPQEPDYQLALTDPAEFTRQRALYDHTMRHMDAILAREAELAEKAKMQAENETKAERQRRLEAEREALYRHFPQLNDQRKAEPFARKLDGTLQEYGYPAGTFGTVEDHRMIRILADAARYRELQSRKGAPAAPAKPAGTVAPSPVKQRGQRVGPSFEDQMRRASTPRERDALLAQRFND